MRHYIVVIFCLFNWYSYGFSSLDSVFCNADVVVGAARFDQYIDNLKGKNVALVGNQSTRINNEHLLDILVKKDVKLLKVFSPEHGFRGGADAGEKVSSSVDSKTGLPIISLYGSHKKPTASDFSDIDIILFDIQDVGARFYTYISTLHYVMEACIEHNKKLIVLDRPNPNGFYVDGPILDTKYKSFVGMHPVPIVHGLTIGEYATMINGENWLNKGKKCSLKIVKCSGWDHRKFYKLPVKPSPNLPNMLSVYLYPSLCLFEGTVVSLGRGTQWPFQVIGHPLFTKGQFKFTPMPTQGAKKPKLQGELCNGINFQESGLNIMQNQKQLQLSWFIEFYKALNLKNKFFLSNNFINLLAGTDTFKRSILAGQTETDIRASWEPELSQFKKKRKQYLLYEDFN